MLLAVSISISENIIFSASLMTLYVSSKLVSDDFSILKFPSFIMLFWKLVLECSFLFAENYTTLIIRSTVERV